VRGAAITMAVAFRTPRCLFRQAIHRVLLMAFISANFEDCLANHVEQPIRRMMNHESALAEAAQHVRRGKRLLVQQHGRIAKLKASGDCTLNAELTLDIFRFTLKVFEDSARKLQELG
jgi:hypothetical protein